LKLSDLCASSRLFLDARDDYQNARVVLLGAPLDITSSFRMGSRDAPQAVRDASQGLEGYSPRLDLDLGDCAFYDAGDLLLPLGNLQASLGMIRQACSVIAGDGKIPFMLGGEHLVTLPAVQAMAEYFPGLVVLHFDAHADLRDDYLGESLSHATVLRRICDVVGDKNVYQFGIRSGTRDEFQFGRSRTNFYPFEAARGLRSCLPGLKGRPVYVTLDIDILDPAYAPGTGTPEPGGIQPAEIFEIMTLLQELQVFGLDIVELAPVYDASGITAMLVAKVARDCLLSFSKQACTQDNNDYR
jgi:agmatinase